MNQLPKEGVNQEISAPEGSYNQILGTLASKIELIASKISGVIIIYPSIALMVSSKIFLTNLMIFYILCNS